MNITFHPHKGYLNTKFRLYFNGESSENFIICRENDSSVIKSITVQPHKTESIYIEEPGKLHSHQRIIIIPRTVETIGNEDEGGENDV